MEEVIAFLPLYYQISLIKNPYVCNVFSRDVLHHNFENYKPEVQELICVADRLGSLMQYETPGFLPNKRIHRGILETI